ncbi:MAG TPA: sulfatase [Thermoanaerobaculia bacterium]|nr:sulfatase [Thermoanaerobaculia bacterium]
MLNSAAVRRAFPLFLLLSALSGCGGEPAAPPALPWERIDLWSRHSMVEEATAEAGGAPVSQKVYFLGAEEVRDMRFVPPQQLVHFPKRTAGQIRVLEQAVRSRVGWRVRVGRDGYFSFIPLGTLSNCACTYRAGVRDPSGQIHELFRGAAKPVGRFAPATVDVDLSPYAGQEVDVLIQIDSPPPPPGQPLPTALWGSPAVYSRKDVPRAGDTDKPNILLIGFDTLRADALGPWGRTPSLTPAIDTLARQSDVWLDAFTAFNVTNPSFVSIMTGLYGKNHGIYDLKTPLPQSHVTLAEHLHGAGYSTLAVISARHLGDHNSGLGQGFDDVVRADEHHAAEMAVDTAIDWIAARAGQPKPFFAWVHLFDPHTPHTPPQPFSLGFRPAAAAGLGPVQTWVPFRPAGPRDFAEKVLGADRDLYDGEVAYMDRQVGRLLDFLESRGFLENTLIVLVADHGESLGEHGIRFRHTGLHDTTTHVPLMIRWPGEKPQGRRFEGLVQTIDLFPTLLRAVDLPVPEQNGEDLRELTGEGRRAVFAEHAEKRGLMVRTRSYKYILSQGNAPFFPDGASLYDLKADPKELQNLAGRNLPAEAEMSNLLRRWLADRRQRPKTVPKDLPPEEIERLRALGYIQ